MYKIPISNKMSKFKDNFSSESFYPDSNYYLDQENTPKEAPVPENPISNMGENIALSVVATEDSNFCNHLGLDIKEIYKVITRKEKRGASTITQQLAKNLFLWSGRSWSRKIIELYFTFLIEIIIPKKRILEIYLNTVETSLLTFGVNQASDKYYKKPANKLTREQSVRIALTLPNPKARSPKNLKSNLTVRVSRLKKDINILKKDDRSGCFL